MFRRYWMAKTLLAAGLLLVAGNLAGTPAAAQDLGAGQAELVNRLYSDGLTRAEMVGLYETLVQGEFEPPACTPGDEMFTDVPASHLFCSWIEELARRGITGGCGDGSAYCPGDPVTRGQMASFILRATADEPPHLVGETGEPEFGNGGEGDCLWMNASALLPGIGPASFYKDSDGIVRLAGVVRAIDGGGGDGICGVPPTPTLGDVADLSDNVIFVLPPGYRPEHALLIPGPSANTITIIAPEEGLVLQGFPLPGGAVITNDVTDEFATTFDGITFRAATDSTTSSLSAEPSNISMEALRSLLHR